MQGIQIDDPRNDGILALLKPPVMTVEYLKKRFREVMPRASEAEIERKAANFVQSLASKTVAPSPPISLPPSGEKTELFRMDAHPDLVKLVWGEIFRECRWRVYGRPALVRPDTGVIFAVAIGTFGVGVRLPDPHFGATDSIAGSGTVRFDLSEAGLNWRFLKPLSDAYLLFPVAYDFAGGQA